MKTENLDRYTKDEIDFIITNKKKYCKDVSVINKFDTRINNGLVI